MSNSLDVFVADAVRAQPWAVVGASNDRSKFGNKIYRDLRAAGYRVYPVNPGTHEVEGDPAYPNLSALPETPVVVDVVVPAQVGHRILKDAVAAGATYFWLQPGAESPDLVTAATSTDLRVIHNRCAMVEKLNLNAEAEPPAPR